MKKLLFLICVPLLFGFVEPKYKDNSILFHFGKILNQYRIDNGRNGLKIDYTLKNFTEERCKYLSEVEYSHNGFEKIKQLPFGFTVAGENIAIVRNIPQNNKPYYSSNIKEIGDIMERIDRMEHHYDSKIESLEAIIEKQQNMIEIFGTCKIMIQQ
jgi:hypothetical protein